MSASPRPPNEALAQSWYVFRSGEIIGPYLGYAIRDMVRDQQIGLDAQVALTGTSEWQPVAAVVPPEPPRPVPTIFAGFWIRAGAFVIDSLVLLVIYIAAIIIAMPILRITDTGRLFSKHEALAGTLAYLSLVAINLSYFVTFTAGGWQATPGKRICNIHVIRKNGGAPGVSGSALRCLLYYLDSLTCNIGFAMAGWIKEKAALHDLICGTRVIYGRVARGS